MIENLRRWHQCIAGYVEVLLQSLPATTNPLMLGAQVYCAYKILNTCKLDKVRQHRIQQKKRARDHPTRFL